MSQLNGDYSASPNEATFAASLTYLPQRNGNGPPPLTATTNQNSTSPQSNGTTSSPLNARSCTTCRKRKVRCDKRHPCSNCNKAGAECIFPGPGRAPRRSRKPPDTELLARLRRLEGVVQNLGKGIDEEGEVIEIAQPPEEPAKSAAEEKKPQTLSDCGMLRAVPGRIPPNPDGMVKEFGRLVVDEGRSRYVSNKFWNSLSEEVAEMRDILDDPTDEEDDYPSPDSTSTASTNNPAFIFSFSSSLHSLRDFHPPLEQIPKYWEIYKENVDPLIKIFHRPCTEKTLIEACQNLDHVSKPLEVMMFAIYFAAVTSISAEECMVTFALEKQAALKNYRFAFEQALARAGFLSTQELVVLQSFTLFLNCVRRYDDTRYVWTLTGLLIRLAQALGIHRDGARFGISPYQTEMRRRLWWQICTLDVRASEDHGSDPSISDQTFDTNFPLNINDEDIDSSMKETPKERDGWSEMTFDLIRFTVSTTVRRLSYAPVAGPCQKKSAGLTLEDKEHLIEELHQYLENHYLKYCDMNVPLHWVAATVARLVMAKMWLIVHHPLKREDGGAGLPQETQDRLFMTSIEVVKFSRLLETEKSTLKWGWLFRTYVQWHAVAFVLAQLCHRTKGPEAEHGWEVVDSVFDEWSDLMLASKRGMLWKPLRKLKARARAARDKELEKEARYPLDGSLGPVNPSMSLPTEPLPVSDGSIDFLNFTPSSMFVDTSLQQPLAPNGSQSFVPVRQVQCTDSMNEWIYDDSAVPPDVLNADESLNWAGWDDMVKNFDMEVEDGQGIVRGPGPNGMTNWW